MSYSINQNFLQGIPQNPYRNGVGTYEGVVCHATACYNDSDESERNYEQGHWNDAFVHGFVDEDSITQTAPFGYLAWGAGHTANQRTDFRYPPNRTSIAIEICPSSGNSNHILTCG